jgi:hypothetical protein
MSIRQHRIDSPAKIKERIADLKGKKITIVLSNNTSVFGSLTSVSDDHIVVENGRLVRNPYLFSAIKELYFDQNV